MGKQRLKWTAEEEEALRAGVAKHGTGKWKDILKDPEFAPILTDRSNLQLKQRYEVPQNFRRVLATELRGLEQQGKIETLNYLFDP